MNGSGKRCQTVGLEDTRHPGKLRKYQCCPVSSSSSSSQRSSSNVKKNKAKLAAIVELEEEFIDEDDLIHDDDDDDAPDDNTNDSNSRKKPYNPHDDPSSSSQPPSSPSPFIQHGDQNYQHRSSSPSHIQSYVYIPDDDFISDAGTEHIASDAFLHHQFHLLIFSNIYFLLRYNFCLSSFIF